MACALIAALLVGGCAPQARCKYLLKGRVVRADGRSLAYHSVELSSRKHGFVVTGTIEKDGSFATYYKRNCGGGFFPPTMPKLDEVTLRVDGGSPQFVDLSATDQPRVARDRREVPIPTVVISR